MSDHSSDTASSRQGSGQGRRRRAPRNNNRPRSEERASASNSGHYNVTRREPKPSGLQKFLSAISFGLLGQTKPKPKAKAAGSSTTSSTSTSRSESSRPARSEQRSTREPRSQNSTSSPRPPREPRQAASPEEVTSERLYVGNLSYDATESDLFELFNGVGQVRNAEVVVNNRTQRSKGFAFVTMTDVEQARRAVAELSNKDFMGRPLQVSGAKPPSKDREGDDESPES